MLLVPSPIFAFLLSFSCPVFFAFPGISFAVLSILVSSPFGNVTVCFPCSFVLISSYSSSSCLTISSGREHTIFLVVEFICASGTPFLLVLVSISIVDMIDLISVCLLVVFLGLRLLLLLIVVHPCSLVCSSLFLLHIIPTCSFFLFLLVHFSSIFSK
jgi:hypothetical protein